MALRDKTYYRLTFFYSDIWRFLWKRTPLFRASFPVHAQGGHVLILYWNISSKAMTGIQRSQGESSHLEPTMRFDLWHNGALNESNSRHGNTCVRPEVTKWVAFTWGCTEDVKHHEEGFWEQLQCPTQNLFCASCSSSRVCRKKWTPAEHLVNDWTFIAFLGNMQNKILINDRYYAICFRGVMRLCHYRLDNRPIRLPVPLSQLGQTYVIVRFTCPPTMNFQSLVEQYLIFQEVNFINFIPAADTRWGVNISISIYIWATSIPRYTLKLLGIVK